MLSGNTLIGVLQGEGRMHAVMKAVIIGTVANIALDPLYIFVLRLGVRGADFATVTAQLAAGSYVMSLFVRRKTTTPLRLRPAAVDRIILARILSVGFPQALGQIAMSLKFFALNRIVVGIDERALAAFTICGRFDQILVLPILAISSAEIAMVGQNYGKGYFGRMRKIRGTCVLTASLVTAGLGGLLFAAAPGLFALFTDVGAVVGYAVRQIRIVVFSYIFAVWPIVGKAYFQALGRSIPGLVADILRLALIPVSAALLLVYVAGYGVEGVWIALVAGNVSGTLALSPWLAR
jgi:Na+-driven multidrug efflux pump